MATANITKRTVDATRPGKGDVYVWDRGLPGFGLKVTPSGRKVYLVQYRAGGGRKGITRRWTIGTHDGSLPPNKARDKAEEILAAVKLGGDPAAEKARKQKEGTIAELADRYLAEHVEVHNKASTAKEARRIVERRIKPELGKHKVSELTRAHIKAWHHAMRGMPFEANRALAYCSKMLSLAVHDWDLRPDNPCKGVKRFSEPKRERFLSDAELRKIGTVLAEAKGDGTAPAGCVNAVRLLAVTGMRLGEVLGLAWKNVDLAAGAIRLPTAKAGARTVPLGAPAVALLKAWEGNGEYVVHGADAAKPLSTATFHHFWHKLRKRAGVPDARPHDLRHTAGTFAAQAGFNAFLVRDLLGHKTLAMAGRYVERATDPLRAAADAFSGRVDAALSGKPVGKVVKLRKQARGV